MVLNVGLNWIDENLPSVLKTDLAKSKKQRVGYSNILHNSDFIQLADFLFKPYSNKSIELMFKNYKKEKDISKINIDEYIPKSNWERYFSKILETEDSYFNKKWTRLYELRCIVAHNSFLSFNEYEEIKELTSELSSILETALKSLDKVEVPEEEKEELIENAASNSNDYIAEFLEKWNEFKEEYLNLINTSKVIDDSTRAKARKYIKTNGRILNRYKVPERKKYNLFLSVRNTVAHHIGANSISEQKVIKYLRDLELLTSKIKNTVPNKV